MKTDKREMNYVQPDCKAFQVKLQQVIATSSQTESLQEEEFNW